MKDVSNKEAAKENQFVETQRSNSAAALQHPAPSDLPEDRRSVFIEKFEEIGMIDPGPLNIGGPGKSPGPVKGAATQSAKMS